METYFLKSIFSDFFFSTISRNLDGAGLSLKAALLRRCFCTPVEVNPRQGVLDVGVDGRVGSDACC